MEGCAGEVIGLIAVRDGGRGSAKEGNRIGETKGLKMSSLKAILCREKRGALTAN